MSNLGGYQIMTKIAKKVGGPKNLVALTMVGGYCCIRTAEGLVKKVVKTVEKKDKRGETYKVLKPGVSNEGLKFNVGDIYFVLEQDDDAVLIEKYGEADNPYFVSAKLLSEISEYKG